MLLLYKLWKCFVYFWIIQSEEEEERHRYWLPQLCMVVAINSLKWNCSLTVVEISCCLCIVHTPEQCHVTVQESKLPLTDPRVAEARPSAHAKYSVSHHMVIKPFLLFGLAAGYRSRQWVWSTLVGRPSEAYDTHHGTKFVTLTVPLSWQRLRRYSRSRDIVKSRRLN